jgi:hypothetical protein
MTFDPGSSALSPTAKASLSDVLASNWFSWMRDGEQKIPKRSRRRYRVAASVRCSEGKTSAREEDELSAGHLALKPGNDLGNVGHAGGMSR